MRVPVRPGYDVNANVDVNVFVNDFRRGQLERCICKKTKMNLSVFSTAVRAFNVKKNFSVRSAIIVTATLLLTSACHTAPPLAPAAPPAQVIVVGAGIAGLVTAYELQKHGIRTQVLEERDTLGGRVATMTYDAGPSEAGMQEIWENNPLLDIVKELNLPLDQAETAFSSVFLDGTLHVYSQDTIDAYFESIFSNEERAAWNLFNTRAAELYTLANKQGLKNADVAHLQEISFSEWAVESHLPPRVRAWLKLTLECEMAFSWEGFSALSGLLDMEIFFGAGLANYHVRNGNSRVVEALAKTLPNAITTGAQVTHVTRRQQPNGAWRVTVGYQKNNTLREVSAERVVVAVPFVRLHQIFFDPPLLGEAQEAFNTLRLGQYAVVHFEIDSAAKKVWMQAGRNPFPVLAGGQLGVIYGVPPHVKQNTSTDIFSLLIYGDAAKSFHMMPRTSKTQMLTAELETKFLGLSKYIQKTHVTTYHPTALPVWPKGRSPIDALAEALRRPDAAMYLAGDYTRGAHATGAVQRAQEVAAALALELR